MVVFSISDKASYDEYINKEDTTVFVDFTAVWCGPCKMMAPVFEKLSGENPDCIFLKVDVDDCDDIAQAENVSAMPTFKAYRGGKKLGEVVGANPNKLKEMVENKKAG